MITILVAEDEEPIREGLIDLLEGEGYKVLAAADGRSALNLYREQGADMALLDIMMPGMSGYELCGEIRRENARIPVIFLSAREEEIDKVVGLELGADDYIVKPFGVRELLARLKSVWRRSGAAREQESSVPEREDFPFAGGVVNPRRFCFERSGIEQELSEREVALLSYFFRRPGEVLSREKLLEDLWGLEYGGTTRTLDQHIAKLRRKIEEDPAHPRAIITVHGTGYRYFREE
ncbi:MAG: response regulator transcription factor [Spirochaetales bacterium]|nr:response regulator transcription factor [Spirochaetales bacterium]